MAMCKCTHPAHWAAARLQVIPVLREPEWAGTRSSESLIRWSVQKSLPMLTEQTGVNGADALLVPKKPAAYGKGGRGGYGGGAGSPPGYAFTGQGGTPIGTVSRKSTPGTPGVGGKSSEGGPAADGCIIVFYRRPVSKSGSGPLVTAAPAWFLDSLGRWFIV